MIRPCTIRVSGREVTVVDEPKNKKLFGYFDPTCPAGWRISLYGLTGQQRASTLFHELLHAMSAAEYEDRGTRVLSEKQVAALEKAFAAVCRDNPKLMRSLIRELTKQ